MLICNNICELSYLCKLNYLCELNYLCKLNYLCSSNYVCKMKFYVARTRSQNCHLMLFLRYIVTSTRAATGSCFKTHCRIGCVRSAGPAGRCGHLSLPFHVPHHHFQVIPCCQILLL